MSIKLTNLLNRNYNLTRNTYIIHDNKGSNPQVHWWKNFSPYSHRWFHQPPPLSQFWPCARTQPPPPATGVRNSSWNNRPSCQERWGNIWSKPQAGFETPPFLPGPQPLRETLSSATALRAAFQTRPRAFQTSKSAGSSQCRAELVNTIWTGALDGCWLPSPFVFWWLTETEWDTSDIQGLEEALKIQWWRINQHFQVLEAAKRDTDVEWLAVSQLS